MLRVELGINVEVSAMTIEVRGYSTDHQKFSSIKCYKMTPEVTGSPVLHVHLDSSYSVENIARDFGTSIEYGISSGLTIARFVSLEFSIFSASTEEFLLSTSLSQMTSNSYTYAVIYELPETQYTSAVFGDDFLTDIGSYHYQEWLSRNDESDPYFRHICGDKVVSSEKSYAALYFLLQTKYSSLFEKEVFESTIRGSVGFLGLSSSVTEAISSSRIHGSQEMKAFQLGGNLADFSSQISSSLACSHENIEACRSLAIAWQNYADSFINSVNQLQNGIPLGNPELISATVFGVQVGNSVLTPEIINAREGIEDLYAENIKYKEVLESYLALFASFPSFSNSFEIKVNELYAKISSNLGTINDGVDGASSCYLQPEYCPQIFDRINSTLEQITETDKSLYGKKFKYYQSDFFGCEGISLLPNGDNGWIVDGQSCRFTLQADWSGKIKNHLTGARYGDRCDRRGQSVELDILGFDNIDPSGGIFSDCIYGNLRYSYQGQTSSQVIRCFNTDGDEENFLCGNTKINLFSEDKFVNIFLVGRQKAGTCYYHVSSSDSSVRNNNPYYLSEFDREADDEDLLSCPSSASSIHDFSSTLLLVGVATTIFSLAQMDF